MLSFVFGSCACATPTVQALALACGPELLPSWIGALWTGDFGQLLSKVEKCVPSFSIEARMQARRRHALRITVSTLSRVFEASGNNKKWVRFIPWDTRDLSLELALCWAETSAPGSGELQHLPYPSQHFPHDFSYSHFIDVETEA